MSSTADPGPPPVSSGRFDGERVLVTGATGFIGGHVVDVLHRLGADVHAIHRGPDPRVSFDTPVTWHRADLTDAEETIAAAAAAQPTHVIHLASLVRGARDPELVVPMLQANLASAVHVLEAARRSGARRVLLAGSLEEPGAGEVASSPYAVSKAAANLYGDYYRANLDLEVVNLQIFMVYGPATPDQNKLVPYVIRTLSSGQAPELASGSRLVDWVYVGDVADGIARCLLVEAVPERPIPMGTGVLSSVRQVVETLVDITGAGVEPSFGSLEERSNEVVRAADVDWTQQVLGWAPSTGLRAGLEATVAWHRAQRAETGAGS